MKLVRKCLLKLYRYLGWQLVWLIVDRFRPLASAISAAYPYTSRSVEYPFVHQNIEPPQTILDIGCSNSRLPIELCGRGNKVIGVDPDKRPARLMHSNFCFVQSDICQAPFKDNSFDSVIAVSTIEHIGLSAHGATVEDDLTGDKQTLKEIERVLKPGGRAIITVPFGRRAASFSVGRVYDAAVLKSLLANLVMVKIEYIVRCRGSWLPASLDEAQDIDSAGEARAGALIVAEKRMTYGSRQGE